MNALNQNLYGNYRNRTFADIWPEVDGFTGDYSEICDGVFSNSITSDSATLLYYLLEGRYGNSTVASSDEQQFKIKLFSLVFQYGPTWEKRLEIQQAIRDMYKNGILSEDLTKGGKAVYNSALNPNQQVFANKGAATGEGQNTLEELTYINSQNTTNYQKSKPEAYAILWDLLQTDVTNEFLTKFKKLFLTVVSPELPLWYVSNKEDITDESDNS